MSTLLYKKKTNENIPGHTLEAIPKIDVKECEARCTEENKCKAFVFYDETLLGESVSVCKLKTSTKTKDKEGRDAYIPYDADDISKYV